MAELVGVAGLRWTIDECIKQRWSIESRGVISVMFSAHEPSTHLPGHRGVTKGTVTCHLGLTIPADTAKYTISVEGKSCNWSPGRFFAFDDTRHHDVWGYTDENRVISLLHVRRPMRLPGALLQSACFVLIRASPFVQGAKRNLRF